MFPVPGGILLVHDQAVLLLDKAGVPKQRWAPGRQITSASFDGTTLAIADLAIVTSLDVGLVVAKSVTLKSPCASTVLVASRFVCGKQSSWNAPFDLYDLSTGTFIGSADSPLLNYSGLPLRPVPGTSDFVSQANDSSGRYSLYHVDSQATVTLLGASQYDGTSSYGTNVYAFIGNPATHLATDDGTLRRIYTSGVTDPTNPQGEASFERDGNLGVSLGNSKFSGLDQSGGEIFGISSLDRRDGTYSFELNRVDVAQRTLVSTRVYTLPPGVVMGFKHDAELNKAWVAFPNTIETYPPPQPETSGYRLVQLDY